MRLTEDRLRIIAVLVAVAGISALYLYSISLDPERVRISDLGEYVGKYVVVQGNVVDAYSSEGSTTLTLSENTSNATVKVFLDSKESVEPGDRVELMGKVDEYHGGYSISVAGNGYFRILKRWESSVLTLPVLAQNPWEYEGQNVNISCRIRYQLNNSKPYPHFVVENRTEDSHTATEKWNYTITVRVYGLEVPDYNKETNIYLNARLEYSHISFKFYLVMDSPEHHIWFDRMSNIRR